MVGGDGWVGGGLMDGWVASSIFRADRDFRRKIKFVVTFLSLISIPIFFSFIFKENCLNH